MIARPEKMRYQEAQHQWQAEAADNYTHLLDAQLFADRSLLGLIGNLTGKRILDIGCGNGYLIRKIQASALSVTGVDISENMVQEAKRLGYGSAPSLLCVASSDLLPLATGIYDAAICSLTINNLSSADMAKNTFREAGRILKPGGLFVISLPHPHTLSAITRYRWTDWEEGQNQESLVPGEGFKRQIMGRDGSMISIVNYYWPKETLTNFAKRVGLELDTVSEETATVDELARHPEELEPVFAEVPFFLVMRFVKRVGRPTRA